MRILPLVALVLLLSTQVVPAQVTMREDFDSLDRWEELHFPKIEAHTKYDIVPEGSNRVLRARSDGSASAIVRPAPYNVYRRPHLRWRWKIDEVLRKGDATRKKSDDYAIRVYVMFIYEPENASRTKRIKYGLAKKVIGEYPPDSTLNYFGANRPHAKRILTNPYADEAKMIVLRTGNDDAGRWVEESVNIIEDYRKAFGTDPPARASLAIMSDTDNTLESATAYIDWLEISR